MFRFYNNESDEMPCKLDSTEHARSFRTKTNPALKIFSEISSPRNRLHKYDTIQLTFENLKKKKIPVKVSRARLQEIGPSVNWDVVKIPECQPATQFSMKRDDGADFWEILLVNRGSGCCSVLQCVAVCCSVLQCVATDHTPASRWNVTMELTFEKFC